jgi:hypothetical protein
MESPFAGSFAQGAAIPFAVFVGDGSGITGTSVTVDVVDASGNTTTVVLLDDGRHGDGAAGDGFYGGTLGGLPPGEYTVETTASGVDNGGVPFERGGTRQIVVQRVPSRTLIPLADSTLSWPWQNRNFGASAGLQIEGLGKDRIVLQFDSRSIGEFLSQPGFARATLMLTISEPRGLFSTTVDAYPLLKGFVEGNGTRRDGGRGPGVTWNCAVDREISSLLHNCGIDFWFGGLLGRRTAPGVVHRSRMTGPVQWDVTQDVRAGASRWLLKKRLETSLSDVSYFSKEGAIHTPDLRPMLILERE